jgi:hypothetical protein
LLFVYCPTYLVQGTSDGVARRLANRRVELSSRESSEEGGKSGLDKHVDWISRDANYGD